MVNPSWTLQIKPGQSLGFLHTLKAVYRYRDLLFLFVRRDFVAQYKQTILGPLWFIIQPVLSTIIFTIIFGNVAQISTNGTPQVLFYLSGIVLWNYFADCLTKTSDTFTVNANIFGKVYFPRIVVPLSIVVSNLIKLAVQLVLFFAFFAYYYTTTDAIAPNKMILLLPLLIFMMGGLGLGFGLFFSSMTTKYRDLKFLLQFGVQLMMYASPIVYPLSIVSEQYRIIILANPVTSIIETFKYAFLGVGEFSEMHLLYSFVFMVLLLSCGLFVFNRIEKSFTDTV